MKPFRGTAAAPSAAILLLLLSAPTALSQPGPLDVRVEMVERYVAAFNTGEPAVMATVLEEIYEKEFLKSFGGAGAAAWNRLELFRTYGPVTFQYVDEEARPPIVWTKAGVSRGWIGHQFHLSDEREPKVVRHTTWRARPEPYPPSSLTEDQVADSMRQYLERMAEAGLFSGSAVLSRHGNPVLTLSVGDDRRPDPAPITDETRFHIASVTKLLTATALLQLVEAGTIGLGDPIARWIPEYPLPFRDQVTLRQLLTHTSGIELDEDPDYLDEIRRAESVEQLLEAQIRHLEGREPRFDPGSEYDYTSEGFDLAGVILERVEGRPWTEVIRDRVLRPAGMTRTRFRIPRDEGEWALGWTSLAPDLDTTIPGELQPATEILTVVAKPSSGAWSTAGDLHRLARALLDHRLLGPAWTDSLLTPRLETGELPKYGLRSWVGLGAQGEDLWGTRTVGHGGVVPGYSAAIEYLPHNGWLLTTISNTGEATGFLVFQRFLELVANLEDVGPRISKRSEDPGSGGASSLEARGRNDGLVSRLDSYFEPLAGAGEFGGVVLIGNADSVLAKRVYGKAHHGLDVAVASEHRFRIASLTKTFTAGAVLVLRDRGQVSLDDPLERWIPGFPGGDRITLRHLLLHRSGVGEPDLEEDLSAGFGLTELVERIALAEPLFEPGEEGRYSNAGYSLLARVVERAAGTSYDRFLRETFFDTFGMTRTGAFEPWEVVDGRAEGYVPGPPPAGVARGPKSDPGSATGSGHLWSTAADLWRWARAVDEGSLFDVDSGEWPYGWGRIREAGRTGIDQTGLTDGFTASLAIHREAGLHVVVLGNVMNARWTTWARDASRIAFGEAVDPELPAEPVAVDRTRLETLAGVYEPVAGGLPAFEAVLRNGSLWFRWRGDRLGHWLAPLSDSEFLVRGECGSVEFETPERLVWHCGDGATVFERTPGSAVGPSPTSGG